MWTCKHCGEESEDTFDSCWKCGWSTEGQPPNPSEEQKQTAEAAKPAKPTFEFPKWLMIVIVLGCVLAVQILKVDQNQKSQEEDSAPIPQDGTPFEVSEKRLNWLRDAFARNGLDDGITGEGLHITILERRPGRKYFIKIEKHERPKDPRIEAMKEVAQDAAKRARQGSRESTVKLYRAIQAGDFVSVSNWIEEARVSPNGDPRMFNNLHKVPRTNNDIISVAFEYPTPLHEAVSRTNLDIAGLLVTKGADVNARNDKGMTALHLAAKDGSTKIVEMLLANHADKEIKDATGKTARDYAAEAGKEEIVNLLTNSVPK